MANKPDEYDFCFKCEYCIQKLFGLWREAVCTFDGYDELNAFDRLIKKLDHCPKEKKGE